jgi:hypothetical protein
MARDRISDEKILAQIPRARLRAAQARANGLRASSAQYDATSGRVVMETTTGYLFGFPVADVPALRNASPEALTHVELSPSGSGLHWEQLDVDLDIPALIVSVLGRKDKIRELARSAGSVTSERKAAAARVNGTRGGRPAIKVDTEPPGEFRVAAAKRSKLAGEKRSTAAKTTKTATPGDKSGTHAHSGLHKGEK